MIRQIFKFLFKASYRIAALIGFAVLVLSLLIYFGLASPKTTQVPERAILSLSLSGEYADHREDDVLKAFLSNETNSLYLTTHSIRLAAQDPKIKGILLFVGAPQMGLAQMQELRDALLAFRQAGKKVYAYSDSFGFGESGVGKYYIASAADKIYMQRMGAVGLTAYRVEQPFLRGVLDKIGVKPEFGKRKKYKSFPEMFEEEGATDSQREVTQAILDSNSEQIMDAISRARSIRLDELRVLADNGPYMDMAAKKLNLVDQFLYRDELEAEIEKDLDTKVTLFSFERYMKAEKNKPSKGVPAVALIFDGGAIMPHEFVAKGAIDTIDNVRTYKTVQGAIRDDHIKAIVYRINSPGGEPVASQTIFKALESAKQAGKPVVVSMGDAAASGGYWVSCAGAKIVAQPGTLTGSIGVFAGKFSFKELWGKIGLNWSVVEAGENGGMWSPNRPFTEHDWDKINLYLDMVYKRFVSLVAQSRNLSFEQAEKIARGRVWTGEQALSLGLVDQLGGIEEALQIARELAGLGAEAEIEIFPKAKSFWELLLEQLEGSEDTDIAVGAWTQIFHALLSSARGNLMEWIGFLQSPPAAYDSNVAHMRTHY